MTAICFWYLVAGTQAKHFMLQDNIAVFTADYGVFAPVHHEFSFICFDANGFYHMQPIAQLPWLGTFTFTSQDSRLIIQHKNQSGANPLGLINEIQHMLSLKCAQQVESEEKYSLLFLPTLSKDKDE